MGENVTEGAKLPLEKLKKISEFWPKKKTKSYIDNAFSFYRTYSSHEEKKFCQNPLLCSSEKSCLTIPLNPEIPSSIGWHTFEAFYVGKWTRSLAIFKLKAEDSLDVDFCTQCSILCLLTTIQRLGSWIILYQAQCSPGAIAVGHAISVPKTEGSSFK